MPYLLRRRGEVVTIRASGSLNDGSVEFRQDPGWSCSSAWFSLCRLEQWTGSGRLPVDRNGLEPTACSAVALPKAENGSTGRRLPALAVDPEPPAGAIFDSRRGISRH